MAEHIADPLSFDVLFDISGCSQFADGRNDLGDCHVDHTSRHGLLANEHLLKMIITAAGIGMFSAVVGVFFSYSYNWPSGATIVLACTAFFYPCFFIFSNKRNFISERKQIDENKEITLFDPGN